MTEDDKVRVKKATVYTLTCPDDQMAKQIALTAVLNDLECKIARQGKTVTFSYYELAEPSENKQDQDVLLITNKLGYSSEFV
ncbi:MAG: hypothetical protein MUP45_01055 [Candidatus Marinimicrobia bacterium]|nr:hypothetical protein [Candidatus Neomarinimicrobiota bacterium]